MYIRVYRSCAIFGAYRKRRCLEVKKTSQNRIFERKTVLGGIRFEVFSNFFAIDSTISVYFIKFLWCLLVEEGPVPDSLDDLVVEEEPVPDSIDDLVVEEEEEDQGNDPCEDQCAPGNVEPKVIIFRAHNCNIHISVWHYVHCPVLVQCAFIRKFQKTNSTRNVLTRVTIIILKDRKKMSGILRKWQLSLHRTTAKLIYVTLILPIWKIS